VSDVDDSQADCVVRFHDIGRLYELDRCIFSLVGQSYRPLNIILTLQRFAEAEIAAMRQRLAPMLGLPGAPTLEVHNLEQPAPKDARTMLLDMGVRAARGRYIGFLDYDDLLYPEAYKTLVSQLRATDSAIAFATVRVVSADVYAQFIRVTSEIKSPFGPGERLVDLFRGNFCPIHSFLLDRHRIDLDDLLFDSTLTWEEDYDFLLQICAKYSSDFGLIKTRIGEYYFKTDGSNSTGTVLSESKRSAYEMVSAMIEARRRITMVSPKVQQENGVSPPEPRMTIREFLDRLDGS
jgi:hypothetical protein